MARKPDDRSAETERIEETDEHPGSGRERQDALLDEALEETFPASDPISITRSPVQ